jgi:hypothetical protein
LVTATAGVAVLPVRSGGVAGGVKHDLRVHNGREAGQQELEYRIGKKASAIIRRVS